MSQREKPDPKLSSLSRKRKAPVAITLEDSPPSPPRPGPSQEPRARGAEDTGPWCRDLGRHKRLSVSVYRGEVRVDIRAYFRSGDGDLRPTRRGISLSLAEWGEVLAAAEEVEEEARNLEKSRASH